jgi:ABC-2 type transport system permease protein
MIQAFAINAALFAASFVAFLALLRSAKRNGSLLQTGE